MTMTLDEYSRLSETERMTYAASQALAAVSGRDLLDPPEIPDARVAGQGRRAASVRSQTVATNAWTGRGRLHGWRARKSGKVFTVTLDRGTVTILSAETVAGTSVVLQEME